jgi:pimeloyl-ACP methyl ester carboxylesterase
MTPYSLFRYVVLSFLLMVSMAAHQPAVAQLQRASLAGIWEGKLEIGKNSLRIVFNITVKNDSLVISLDSPDQGAKGFAAQQITVRNDSLIFTVPTIGGRFEGRVSTDSRSMNGLWMQGAAALPLTMKLVDKIAEVSRPQTPLKPYPYTAIEVSYRNMIDSITLAGTLTVPNGNGPFPAVILITGSGAQDRDESLLGHKPFLIIADYLTRRGIAVLRVDDRGIGGSTGRNKNSTSADFANDVLAGVEFLKGRTEVNRKKIGLVGHSEGGMIAPMVAVRSADIAFIVLLAGTGLTGAEIITLQSELIARANGDPDDDIRRAKELNAAAIAIAKQNLDSAAERTALRSAVEKFIAALPDSQRASMKNPVEEVEVQTRMFFSPWVRYFLTYDPRTALRKVKCPVLAMNGEKDLQVPPKENLGEIEKALKAGKNKQHTIRLMPGLNHLFQHAETGSPLEYGKIEETFAPEALQVMGEWIGNQVK